jgi:hypothetical protein
MNSNLDRLNIFIMGLVLAVSFGAILYYLIFIINLIVGEIL